MKRGNWQFAFRTWPWVYVHTRDRLHYSCSKEAFCTVDQPNPGEIEPSFSISGPVEGKKNATRFENPIVQFQARVSVHTTARPGVNAGWAPIAQCSSPLACSSPWGHIICLKLRTKLAARPARAKTLRRSYVSQPPRARLVGRSHPTSRRINASPSCRHGSSRNRVGRRYRNRLGCKSRIATMPRYDDTRRS